MMKLTKNWTYKTIDHALVGEIVQKLRISRPAAAILATRGISSVREAEAFLYPETEHLTNPFLLPDIDAAVARIRKAVDAGEKILVYGDRDVDGVTSISIMVRTLRSLGADPLWYIPSDEGYGVHNEIIERYAQQGVTLIVTVDCGISAVEETEYARGRGIDVVITDHHEPPSTGIPKALAIVDPKRTDSKYPFADLAGCSVSFKVSEALMQSFGRHFNEELAAVAVAGQKAAAVKAKNGLVLEEFSTADLSADQAKLAAFVGKCRLVAHEGATPVSALQVLFPESDVVDVASIAKTAFPAHAASFVELAADVRLPAALAGDTLSTARTLYELFRRIERQADLRMGYFQSNNLDLIALGTIADIMPLTRENRAMVKQGLKKLQESRKVGVQALLERCLNRNSKPIALSAKSISWSITPVLNAAGRRGKANLSAELLLTEESHVAGKLLDEIIQLNTERKELQAENLEKFKPLLSEQCDLENDKIFIVTATGLEHGVTGIIASQIMRQYRRPTILLIIEGQEAMGAARSIEGFDIVSALSKVNDILIKYGGHHQAAGLTISVDKLDEFRSRLKAIAGETISPELLIPTVEIDTELQLSEASLNLINELSEFEPYGMGNPYPVFGLRDLKVKEHSRIGTNGDHLRLKVSKNGSIPLTAVGWGLGHLEEEIADYSTVDLAVQLELNVWQDKQSIQLLIQDIKPSEL